MFVRVICAGVSVGTADFEPADGVAHAELTTSDGYVLVAGAARALGERFTRTQCWLAAWGDFAEVAAAWWPGDRLALEDAAGRELAVPNVVLLELPSGPGFEAPRVGTPVRVVADFRPDAARVEAFLRTLGPGGGGHIPPAA